MRNILSKRFGVLLGLALSVSVAGCGGDDSPSAGGNPDNQGQPIPPTQAVQSERDFVDFLMSLAADNETEEPTQLAAIELPASETSEPLDLSDQ